MKNYIDEIQERFNKSLEYSKLSNNFELNPTLYKVSQTTARNMWGQVVSVENRPPNKRYRHI